MGTIITKVLLADDHPTLMLGLATLLSREDSIKVVTQTENGEDALAQIKTLQPNVAVLDCKLPGLSGIQIAERIKQNKIPVNILALSAYDNPRYLWGMYNAGASGYLLKEEAPAQIVKAVKIVACGEQLWTLDQLALAWQWHNKVQSQWDKLTPREKEVMRSVSTGKKNREIADVLNVSERTIEYHLTNILGKLNVASRQEAIVWVNNTLSDNSQL